MGRSRRTGPDRRIRAEKGNYSRAACTGFPPLRGSNAAFRMQRRAALFARGVGAPGQEANSQEYRRLGPAAAGAGAGQTRGGRLNPPSSIPPAATQGRDAGRRWGAPPGALHCSADQWAAAGGLGRTEGLGRRRAITAERPAPAFLHCGAQMPHFGCSAAPPCLLGEWGLRGRKPTRKSIGD